MKVDNPSVAEGDGRVEAFTKSLTYYLNFSGKIRMLQCIWVKQINIKQTSVVWVFYYNILTRERVELMLKHIVN